MCIGIPMRIVEITEHQALVQGRDQIANVDLRLVGPCQPGDWLLVFLGAAREKLDAVRAAEINAALDLLQAGLDGMHDASVDPGFVLPSSMSAAELAALTGSTSH